MNELFTFITDMLFNSLAFVFFLPIVFIGFFLLPVKWRSAWMLLASYYFYFSWSYWMGLLLIATTLFDWCIGLKIQQDEKNKKLYLYASLLFNLGLLFGFKYFGSLNTFTAFFGKIDYLQDSSRLSAIAIPIGISFYTFQSLSYVFDVYNNKIAAEKNLKNYALFVAFFPQLVAGPIERYQHLSSQFTFKIKLHEVDFKSAIQAIIFGFFKKMVIADRVGEYVDVIFKSPDNFHPIFLLIGVIGFTIQLVCDFSGYTDIASGVAKLFGIDLMINFKRPLLSKSIKAFWQRHHISLMSWLRDYIYFPLGGNRTSKIKWLRNIFIVFLLSGLWHGAKANFLFWGFCVAIVYLAEHFLINKNKQNILKSSLSHLYFIVMNGLLFSIFRSKSLDDSLHFLRRIFNSSWLNPIHLQELFSVLNQFSLWLTLALVMLFFTKEIFDEYTENQMIKMNPHTQNLIHFGLLILIFIAGRFNTNLFIYFQF
jgi:alginate O-acetyltransferase complex protein AlgI